MKTDTAINTADFSFKKEISTIVPLTIVSHPVLNAADVTLFVKRDDLIHPFLSGNKYYKLKYNLEQASKSGHDTLLTFGGAYSNHIYATAAAGRALNFRTIGVIRGEEKRTLNPTLSFAKECGMIFHYLDRVSYRNKRSESVIESLMEKYGSFYLIPEGGSNSLAVKGCSEIINKISTGFDYVCCAVGTGCTLAGLAAALDEGKKALGFSVLKGAYSLKHDVRSLLRSYCGIEPNNWEINFEYHFGGYAKLNLELIEFVEFFQKRFKIPIEPIYTGKMFYGIFDLVKKGFFPSKTKIIAIHTGGLQGLSGMAEKIRHLKKKADMQV